MALSGITAAYQPAHTIASSPLPLDEDGHLESSDPKSQVAQQIIEKLFTRRDKEEPEKEAAVPEETADGDTVTISSESMELYNRTSTSATITLADGSTITLSHESMEYARMEQTMQTQSGDPLVLDLDHNGLHLTDVSQKGGVLFDLTGDGRREQVSWLVPGDGFLAWDRNQNGRIDSGNELFGDQHGAADGFAELARYDLDENGVIDSNDGIFSNLKVWQDKNQNGISEAGELKGVAELGIESISVRSAQAAETIANNRVTGYSHYGTAVDRGVVAEVWLNYYA